ncbi:MAG: hypothetical protein I3273_02800 [Candidatus Moeniiplasma glomeromycotorum]|nr:hypothetical protein [Candidatus Moeniiplasma glomeromycotorum]MCE8167616.1 hypothetical protein [Candidatus Moeniiplasma glomeromycotorum]MCE8169034.1 hypothetical protein [Candidatus Moeniiplasma glomeromycotorum]
MICFKCENKIKKEEKHIIIEDLTICKKCAKNIAYRCHTCRDPIFEGDLVYEVTPNWSAEHIFGISQSEKVVQCDWCYQEWLGEQEQKRKWWNRRRWILGTCSVLLLTTILFLLYPTLEENWTKLSIKGKHRPWVVCIILISFSFIITLALYWIISSEFGSRHKDRREIRKRMRIKNKNNHK